jgi:hypothetical protein
MSKEKVILSLLSVLVGLFVAALGFYFYQGARYSPPENSDKITVNPTETPKPNVALAITEPEDESVSDKKVITLSGKTDPDSLIIILTEDDEQVLNPSEVGNFTTTVTLVDGENFIQITAIAPNGESVTVDRVVTYSTESF